MRVTSNKVQGSDKTIYQNLQTSLYEFINNTKFTEINFRSAEKIECSMLVDVTSREGNYFTAEISLALRRPVYKSNYSTPLFNYIDRKFYFEYTDGQPLDFNPNTYISNLTSTMGFYVYLFLGLDFDSFSPNGGDPFFAIAETIANAAPQEAGSRQRLEQHGTTKPLRHHQRHQQLVVPTPAPVPLRLPPQRPRRDGRTPRPRPRSDTQCARQPTKRLRAQFHVLLPAAASPRPNAMKSSRSSRRANRKSEPRPPTS